MPKVDQEHLDARRAQIVDAARVRFAAQGFAGTSMGDIVAESGLSTGAIYRYFAGKDELVLAVCEQGAEAFPQALTAEAIAAFVADVRRRAAQGHARLVAQIYAEAALNPALGAVVARRLAELRDAVEALGLSRSAAEAFVAVCVGYSAQLAVRGDVDPAPVVAALLAVVRG
jgi:TetR/AcrR family transcriptional regulator, transcriptional repressor of aconitase